MIAKTVLVLCFSGAALGFSVGASEESCEDMLPKHPVGPQTSVLPYKVTLDKNTYTPGDRVKITISGAKPFKGYMLQVRHRHNPVGTFTVKGDNRYSMTFNCSGVNTSATHKDSTSKNDLVLTWSPPRAAKKTYTVYATIAEDGMTYWVRKATAIIIIK